MPSPIALAKGVKNQAELEGMRAAHVRDGVAMVLALSRLERDIAAGQTISEVDVDQRTTASRAQEEKFVGEHNSACRMFAHQEGSVRRPSFQLHTRTLFVHKDCFNFKPVFRLSCCEYTYHTGLLYPGRRLDMQSD